MTTMIKMLLLLDCFTFLQTFSGPVKKTYINVQLHCRPHPRSQIGTPVRQIIFKELYCLPYLSVSQLVYTYCNDGSTHLQVGHPGSVCEAQHQHLPPQPGLPGRGAQGIPSNWNIYWSYWMMTAVAASTIYTCQTSLWWPLPRCWSSWPSGRPSYRRRGRRRRSPNCCPPWAAQSSRQSPGSRFL